MREPLSCLSVSVSGRPLAGSRLRRGKTSTNLFQRIMPLPKVARRKRLTKRKCGRYKKKPAIVENEQEENNIECDEHASGSKDLDSSPCADEVPDVVESERVDSSCLAAEVRSCDHDYCSATHESLGSANVRDLATTNQETSDTVLFSSVAPSELTVDHSHLLLEVKKKADAFLHHRWISVVEENKIHVMCLSVQDNKAIQRSLQFSSDGRVELFVHRQPVSINPFLVDVFPFVPLDSESVNYFVDRVITIVNSVRNKEVCSGYDEVKYEAVWSRCPFGEIDKNMFGECRYVETFRSLGCLRLVSNKQWRCSECAKMATPLRRRLSSAAEVERNKFTANKYLNEEERLKKLADQRRELDNTRKKLSRLQQRMQEVLEKESVCIDNDLSSALAQILDDSGKVTPAQSIFLQQQIKASQQKNAVGMRWHPTMIRFALSLHLTSPAAYQLMRDTGMIKLPCSRTLFDYSHAKPVEEGIDKGVLEKLAAKVEALSNEINSKTGRKESHKKYHTLMGDEMYISQNLLFQKSSGKLIGFTSLDQVDRELKMLEQMIDKPDKEFEETIASRIMVYMIKGVTNGLKEVVATFAVSNMSVTQMKVWTWQVIGALERSGVAVIAFVCDGSAVNRAFIQSHKPATPHPSGIIFDTVNKCARNRRLFFLSDVPHLLKTIRNCLLNSRWDKKKSRRRMMKNRSRVSWDYIIKLYQLHRGKTLRKSFKLNVMNVYPDSYARMKVKYAGQVLSKTVSLELSKQGWPEAMETALFLGKVNDWFDCLNGAHSSIAKRRNQPNVAPYTSPSDDRFNLLSDFLSYLDEWENEAKTPNLNCTVDKSIVDTSATNLAPEMDESDIDEGGPPEEEETNASKRILRKQTLDGIRMTTLAFQPLVLFLLEEGAAFINARVFTQDPLEQHFSKLRAGQGGSTNPNLGQTLKRTHALELIGEMGMKKRKGNSGECADYVEVTTEKLPKLKSTRIPKFAQVKSV